MGFFGVFLLLFFWFRKYQERKTAVLEPEFSLKFKDRGLGLKVLGTSAASDELLLGLASLNFRNIKQGWSEDSPEVARQEMFNQRPI